MLPRTLSIETGFETRFATMVPTAPPRILPRARAAQTSTLTWGFVVVLVGVVLVGIWHWTATCGRLGEAKATPKTREAQAVLTHTRTQCKQKSIIASKYQTPSDPIKGNQSQLDYIRVSRPLATLRGILNMRVVHETTERAIMTRNMRRVPTINTRTQT